MFGKLLTLAIALLVCSATLIAGSFCELGGMERGGQAEQICCSTAPSEVPQQPEFTACCADPVAPLPALAAVPLDVATDLLDKFATPPLVQNADHSLIHPAVLETSLDGPSPPSLRIDLTRRDPAHAPPALIS